MADKLVRGVTNLQPIARGGASVVYRGTQEAFGRTVAVKILNADMVDANHQARFQRECHAIGSLSGHPNVVTVHDAGLTGDGHPYLVMEYLPRSVADVLAEDGPMGWRKSVALGVAVAAALSAAHAQGVLHRDVKPGNILIGPGDVPKLSDFGLARYADAAESQTATVTASFTHASPELVQGQPVDERSDVYSLASTLYEVMSGLAPFVRPGDQSLVPIIGRILTEPPPSLGRHGVPVVVEDVILAGMAKDPAHRPDSVAAFADRLLSASRGAAEPTVTAAGLADTITFRRRSVAPDEARLLGGTTQEDAPRKRRWAVLVLIASAAAALGVGAWAIAARESESDADPSTAAATTTATVDGPAATATEQLVTTTPSVTTTAVAAVTASTVASTTAPTTTTSTTTTTTTAPNRAPTIAVTDQTTNEKSSVDLTLTGFDQDGDPLTYTVTGLPSSLKAAGGHITGTVPSTALSTTTNRNSIKSKSYTVQVKVSDSKTSTTKSFTWTIRDTYTKMPNYVDTGGDTPNNIDDLFSFHPFAKACDSTSVKDVVWRQPIAPGTVVKWGATTGTFYYGLDPSNPSDCVEDVAKGW